MDEVTRDLAFQTRLLVQQIAELTGEAKDEVMLRAVEERLRRLTLPTDRAERKQKILNILESSLWGLSSTRDRERTVSRADEDDILGYGPEGV